MNALRKRHNRIKRRLAVGMGKPNDESKLKIIKERLGYNDRSQS